MTSDRHIVIVGGGHAGGRVAQHLRALDFDGRLTMVGEEAHPPYERPALSKELLVGERPPEDLVLGPNSFWTDSASVRWIRERASRLDASQRMLTLADGSTIAFDELVVATGGRARTLAIPGADLPGVHSLRTIADSLALRDALKPGSRVTIIGAGVIGMEVAASAVRMQAEVIVLEAGRQILARCLPSVASDWLRDIHVSRGTRIETQVGVTAIAQSGSGLRVHAVRDSGEAFSLDTDIVLVAVGIESAVEFLDGSGIATAGGIPVGEDCRSPVAPWCLAAGDVSITYNSLYDTALRQETWRNAESQARAVAEFLMGRTEPFLEIPWMWTDQFEHNIQVVGRPDGADEVITSHDKAGRIATILSLRGGRIVAGVLINNGRDRRYLEKLIRSGVTVERHRLADVSISLKELC
ncbi:NAD(P)/FAD-dependent oxidoreductase [Cupriavidus sp. CuC1]|uniref:NAD(P)/FAD-dependent oxidoreductase n=1 Tax=Cupriavidus sp. CuC1 TaxID=3373131 RepID=UPI0037CFBDA2